MNREKPKEPEIRPQAGQLWENEGKKCFISEDDKKLYCTWENAATTSPIFAYNQTSKLYIIHGKNGWRRVYPLVIE